MPELEILKKENAELKFQIEHLVEALQHIGSPIMPACCRDEAEFDRLKDHYYLVAKAALLAWRKKWSQ